MIFFTSRKSFNVLIKNLREYGREEKIVEKIAQKIFRNELTVESVFCQSNSSRMASSITKKIFGSGLEQPNFKTTKNQINIFMN